jgi:hypothetical protein
MLPILAEQEVMVQEVVIAAVVVDLVEQMGLERPALPDHLLVELAVPAQVEVVVLEVFFHCSEVY